MNDIEYDLCIVGAGFFGCAAARHASANSGLKICLIGLDEPTKEEYPRREIFSSHYDTGRIMRILTHSPTYQKLARRSLKGYKELEKLSGVELHNPVGCMVVGKRESRLMKALEDISAAVGTSLIEMSDNQFIKKYPFLKLKNDEYGIIDSTGSGILQCCKVLEAEKQVALQQGCHILTDCVKEVGNLVDSHHIIETLKHGKIKAKRVLLTLGCFTYYSNFKVLPKLYMYVYKELAVKIKVSEKESERLSSMPAMIYKRDELDIGNYILPPMKYPDGKHYLKIGSLYYDNGEGVQTLKEVKNWYLSKERPGELESISERLFEAIPDLKSEGLSGKVCVTCETPTGFPYIHQLTPTVTVATAGNGWGSSIGEEVGRLAACLSLTGKWDSEIPKSLFDIVLKNPENARSKY